MTATQTAQMLAGIQDAIKVKQEGTTGKLDRLATSVTVPKLSKNIVANSIVTRLTEYYDFYERFERYLVELGLDLALISWMQDCGQKLSNLYEERAPSRRAL